ncbi:S9 family peptidase [Robertkochia sediminum]|uniref:S9 family peptidase n=1 Tax=Robertkochia sediminum TaxID=2785326 RepID=UPI0019315651|nr:prolyl oligopeptidase family serine peptidase [Robertkochia sediminum]MBL7472676.1 prolyl oligopeptidase family serine peptidase [Robertkochia sediminum]
MRAFLIAILLLLVLPARAQEKIEDPKKWTPEDVIFTEYMTNVKFSNDGTKIVWSKRRPLKDPEKDKFVSDLYLTYLDKEQDGKPVTVQLTNTDENDYGAVFSDDDRSLYFLSSRDEGKVLWKLDLLGGEPKKVHTFDNGISDIQWKDSKTLLFVSNDGKTLTELEEEKKKDNVIVVEDTLRWKPQRLYSFDLEEKNTNRLTNNTKPLTSYTVSHNGQWVVYTMAEGISFASDARQDPSYFLLDLSNGKQQQILEPLEFPSGSFSFTPDDKGFYFTSSMASDPEWNGAGIEELYYFDLATTSYTKVDLNWENGLGRGFEVVDGGVIAALANRATFRLTYYEKQGDNWKQKKIDLEEKNDHADLLAVNKAGNRVIYSHSTASQLPRFFAADVKSGKFKNDKEVIALNKNLSSKPLTKSEVITWKGYNDVEVTGILYYPANYESGKKYPLVLSIHGGPSSQDTDRWSERWSTYPNILAQRGAFVLKPNYQGSSNHGLEYVEAIKGNYYEPEMEDIIKGIGFLNEKGMINMDKLGTMGWSNGAILTTMLTVRYPEMFKFAAAGAGDVNWTSDYGTCRFGVSFDQSYFGGAPWDNSEGKTYNENYILKSPLFELEKVRTPTIIFHGSEDRAVPRDQGWEYYRALQQIGEAPVRFLWFPGQRHGLAKITHQLRKMKEELAWIDTYLFEKAPETMDPVKEDSPLALLMAKGSLKKHNGLWGDLKNDTLIPEVTNVKNDSIAIGVFEVTNAQFAAWKKDHRYDEDKGNYPVTCSLEEAKNYLSWLSELTGETYRLPNTEEAKALRKKAMKSAGSENTLSQWAGYALTPEDAAKLISKVNKAELELTKPVGQYKATSVGNALIYDLGGNVSEYAADGKSIGFSAYENADQMAQQKWKSKTSGFRVIKE